MSDPQNGAWTVPIRRAADHKGEELVTFAGPPDASIREIEAEIELFEDMSRTKPVFADFYRGCIEELNEWLNQAIEERDNLLR